MPQREKNFQVIFLPSGRRGDIAEGKTILEASRDLGVQIESTCGGEGLCGKCKVRLEEGDLSPFTQEEKKFISEKERNAGYRMGCAARILGDVRLFVPEESRAEGVVRKAAAERSVEIRPAITLHYIEPPPPTFQDQTADFERVERTLSKEHNLSPLDIDPDALARLPDVLRQGNWKVTATVWMGNELIDIKPGKVEDAYGLAIDVGTTTVAAYLCHLQSGRVIATESMMNPQVAYGEDVMSRITYAMTHAKEGLETLNRSIVDGLNALIQAITRRCGLSPCDILDLTLVGNTTMHHLLLNIDPQYLGVSPFPPAIHRSFDVKARHLGLKVHPSANVHVLPIEAGFVGADNVGVLIAEEPYNRDEMVLIIDIGTNGELVMGNRKRLLSSSCATGPAFEGAHIQFGMRAAPGAVEKIRVDPQTFEVDFRVIGEEAWHSEKKTSTARGICGSGIIDAVAEFYRAGVIDKTGRFNNIPSPRWRVSGGRPEFVIAWKDETAIGKDIVVTQQDVRNVQLAKAALYTGAKLMMKRLGIESLDKVVLAGAFGSTIDTEKAMILGIFPDCDLKNVVAAGNAAGEGARMALLNRDKRKEAEEIAKKVEYIELTIAEDFQNELMDAIQIPHGRDEFPHLRGIVRDEILKQ